MPTMRSTIIAGLTTALLIGCGPTASESPSPDAPAASASPPAPTVLPTATAMATAAPTVPPTVRPTETIGPTAPPSTAPSSSPGAGRWEVLTSDGPELDPEVFYGSMIGFDGGYVVYMYSPRVVHSADGTRWSELALPVGSQTCDDGSMEYVEAAATNGTTLVLLGGDDAECESMRPVAWVTSDGRGWQRSEPFGPAYHISEAKVVDVWAVPGGWEAAISNTVSEQTEILRSADGLTWERVSTLDVIGGVEGASDEHGQRVLTIHDAQGSIGCVRIEQGAFLTSSDGVSWDALKTPYRPAAEDAAVWRVHPPTAEFDEWVVEVSEFLGYPDDPMQSCTRTTFWASSDLRDWRRLRRGAPPASSYPPVPAEGVIGMSDGPAGVLALVADGRVYRLLR